MLCRSAFLRAFYTISIRVIYFDESTQSKGYGYSLYVLPKQNSSMKGEKTNWEFHGFSSNPQKSYEAGKKGSVLATQASLKDVSSPSAEAKSTSKVSSQSSKAQGKGWQNPNASSKKSNSKKSSEETED
jgi:hypothetical protein